MLPYDPTPLLNDTIPDAPSLLYGFPLPCQAQDDSASSRLRRRKKRSSGARTPADGRPRRAPRTGPGAAADSDDSDSLSGSNIDSDERSGSDESSDSGSGSDSSDDEVGGRKFDAMDANSLSLSFRDGASGGLLARSRRHHAERKAEKASKRSNKSKKRFAKRAVGGGSAGGSSSSSSSEEEDGIGTESRRLSRKMAETYITESMSVTPASSVACGSLMGRSLGQAMSSSFADDGLVWGAAAAGEGSGLVGTPDDAFFHENVSPSASPPLASSAVGVAAAAGAGAGSGGMGVRSKGGLF